MYIEHLIQTDIDLLTRLRRVGGRIGNTPLHRISGLFSKKGVRIFVKKEWEQLSGSVKARAAFNIIRAAVESGEMHRGKILLDATSGNTGIAYAAIAKELGLCVALCLPENASPERKTILQSLGAEIIFTSRFEGTDGAQQVALELASQRPEIYFYADQYKNENNWKAHYQHTAIEIVEQLSNAAAKAKNNAGGGSQRPPAGGAGGGVTHFVAGLGTTGTFVGTGRRLKELYPDIQLVALQPDSALHGLEGWKHLDTAVVPGIYDATLADTFLEVDTADAYEIIKAAKRHEGLLLSPSSAANLVGAIKVAEKTDAGTIVTVLPDNADKYGEVIKSLF